MTTKTEIIILRETAFQSIVSDLATAAILLSCVGLGIWTGSTALQWVGGFIAMIGIIGKASGKVRRLSIADARAKLDEIEARREAA